MKNNQKQKENKKLVNGSTTQAVWWRQRLYYKAGERWASLNPKAHD
jgi:hypothetical protein